MSNTLVVESISKHYPTRSGVLEVLHEISLSVNEGESVAIMGPSGSGKSTLLNILGTLEPPSGGRVLIESADPFTLPEDQLAHFRNRRIGFVFQEHHLLPQCNVLENALLPALASAKQIDDQTMARSRELLERMNLSNRLDHHPAELSGGERQRVAIARALLNRPVILLADEPTGNLDGKTASGVGDLLCEAYRDERCVLIVVTHNEAFAKRFDRTLHLDDGRLVDHSS